MAIETYEKVILDMLTPYSVSVLKQTFADIDGEPFQVGMDWRRAFSNSEEGRKSISEFLANTPQLNAVIAVWGDTITVSNKGE